MTHQPSFNDPFRPSASLWRAANRAVTAGLVFTAALWFAASGASAYTSLTGTLQVSSKALTSGQSVDVSGNGFAPGATVTISQGSSPSALGTTTAAAGGSMSATVKIPNEAAGTYQLQAAGATSDGGVLTLSAQVSVGGTVASLSTTGASHVRGYLETGLGLLLVGALLAVVVRRRLRHLAN